MEILIIGLILVAVMVWASTKIKRTAAQAFDAEEIHADGFTLEKPEGFLNRVYEKHDMLFDAYSKEFGTGDDDNVRAATAVVYATDEPINEAASLEQSRLLSSDRSEMFELGGSHCIIVTGSSEKDGRKFNISEKLLGQGGRTLVLKIEVLAEPDVELSRKIEQMLLSFNPR
jgi:hypothetical protein